MTLFLALAAPAVAGTNYLVIIADDFGTDKVSSYLDDDPAYRDDPTVLDMPHTPTIDSLATAGARFTQAWANPSCSPTRASLQTGVHAFRHDIGKALNDDQAGLDPAVWGGQLLGTLLADAGYATGYFGKWHLGAQNEDLDIWEYTAPDHVLLLTAPHPVRLGFDRFYGTIGGMMDPGYADWPMVTWDEDSGPFFYGAAQQLQSHATGAVTDAAATWIAAQTGQTAPWVAFVAYHAPHSSAAGWTYADLPPDCPHSTSGCLLDQDCVDPDRAVYEALVECMDLEIGGLLAGIDHDELDDTLVVFLGDNGTPDAVQEGIFRTFPHGKGTVYESGIRVPLIVADGGAWLDPSATAIDVTRSLEVTAPVQVLDLHRTLLDDAGISAPATDSESLWDCLTGSTGHCGRDSRFLYTEKFEFSPPNTLIEGIAAVQYGTAEKMHVEYVAAPPVGPPCLRTSFFDVAADLHEETEAAFNAFKRARLRDWFADLHDGIGSWGELPFCL